MLLFHSYQPFARVFLVLVGFFGDGVFSSLESNAGAFAGDVSSFESNFRVFADFVGGLNFGFFTSLSSAALRFVPFLGFKTIRDNTSQTNLEKKNKSATFIY